jgi:VWFA-related protein
LIFIRIASICAQLLLTFAFPAAVATAAGSANTGVSGQNDTPGISQSNSAIKADVVLVPVDVVVRDKKGIIRDDLRADDFTIYDNDVAQKISFFSHEEMPLDVALLVDGSGSEALYVTQLRDAALTVLQQLSPKDDRVALFCFGTFPLQLTGFTQNHQMLKETIAKIPNMDNTNIKDALWNAAQYLESKRLQHRRAIILISDNRESFPNMHSEKETLDEMLESGTILYSIKTKGKNPLFLGDPEEIAMFARETGGEVINADSVAALPKALNTVIANLKHSYTLGFNPSDRDVNGSFHEIKVKLTSGKKCPDCRVQARSGYYLGGSAASRTQGNGQSASAQPPRLSKEPQNIPLAATLGKYLEQSFDIRRLHALTQTVQLSLQQNSAERKLPDRSHASLDFAAKANKWTDKEGKRGVKIDITLDAASILFVFNEAKYRAWLAIIVWTSDTADSHYRIYEMAIPEEQFIREHNEVALSIEMPVPPPEEDLRVLVFEPFHEAYGVQMVKIQP